MKCKPEDYDLKTLIDLDGQTHWQKNYWIKIIAKQVDVTAHRPHGIKYSLTLHDSNNTRIIGFDNAHEIKRRGRRPKKYTGRKITWDHVHRLEKVEFYTFISASQLLQDFWDSVNKVIDGE